MGVGFFFSSRRRHTRWTGDWSSDVCSSDLLGTAPIRLDLLLQGLAYSADRAGLLLSGDVASCLSLAVRESAIPSAFKDDPSAKNVEVRADLRELMQFAISDDFFRLRADLGLSI